MWGGLYLPRTRHGVDSQVTCPYFGFLFNAQSICLEASWHAGMNGESEVRLTDLTTGALIKKKRLDQQDFGEGLVRSQDRSFPCHVMQSRIIRFTFAMQEILPDV